MLDVNYRVEHFCQWKASSATWESQQIGQIGSKTALMNVIGFLCVSLGSSIVQLHDSLGSRCACTCSEAGFSSQNGDCTWGFYCWRAVFCYGFLCAKGLSAKDIRKKCFLFIVGSVCQIKRFTTGWQTFCWLWRGWNGGAEVAETTVKRLPCCGFWHACTVMGQVYQCWWRICKEINVFFFWCSNITWFTFYVHLWPVYWLSLIYMNVYGKEQAVALPNLWSFEGNLQKYCGFLCATPSSNLSVCMRRLCGRDWQS
jgi:hypothetical protein